MNRIIAFLSFLALFVLGIQIKLKTPEKVEVEEAVVTRPKKIKVKKADENIARRPASVIQKPQSSFQNVDKNEKVFREVPEELAQNEPETAVDSEPSERYQSFGSQATYQRPQALPPIRNNNSSKSPKVASGTSAGRPEIGASPRLNSPGSGPCLFCMKNPETPQDDDSANTNDTTSGSSGGGSLSCSASIGNGSYSNPFTVALTCTSAADIKYTLTPLPCGDPELGTSYAGSFTVNPGAGDFCLSFKGTTSGGVESNVVEKYYTFNPALPDIQVAHLKTYFQSTELQGVMSIASSDYSNPDYSMGVVNLKSHNPAPGGLNLTCQEIAEDYSTLTSPVPALPMADTNVSGFAVSSQVDVFLHTTNLAYGDNHITSYLRNNAFADPVYSCSTTNIVLEDFPFFDPSPHHGYIGSDDVREFSGGFTHLGFFEPAPTVFRGPAGTGSETTSNQELETGLFGIFY